MSSRSGNEAHRMDSGSVAEGSAKVDADAHEPRLAGVVVAHAALSGGMMSNFGRLFATRAIAEGAELHFYASATAVYGFAPPVEELEGIGGTFHGLDIGPEVRPWAYLRALRFLWKEFRSRGVQVLHTRSLTMGILGRLAGRLAGVPCIVHHQDDLHCRDEKHGPFKRWSLALIERLLARLGHKTLFVSEAVLEDSIRAGFDPSRCQMVGHDLSEFFQDTLEADARGNPERHPIFDACQVPGDAIIIGCVARLATLKGIDTLIETAEILCAEHDRCVFFIKGDGPLRKELMEDVRTRGLEERVFFGIETLPQCDLPWLNASFDLFFLPTRREGFGMAFAEAMAMGVPVVGPNKPPVTEVVGDCGILVEPEDVAGYAQALRSLLASEELREDYARRGHARAVAKWGGARSAEVVIDSYCELLGRRAR